MGDSAQNLSTLILAPIGQDSKLLASALEQAGIHARVYRSMESLCADCEKSAGVLLIAEEALNPTALQAFKAALARQETWSDIPVVLMTGAGESAQASMRVLQSIAPSGNVTLLERPFRAITLVSIVQVALRARQRQYQVRELLVQQKKATEIRDEFISMASHELKTPLTSLKLQVQLSNRIRERDAGAFSEKAIKLIDTTGVQVERLTRLVEDMLDISRINSGKLLLDKNSFDLGNLVVEIVDRLMPQLQAVGCSVETVCEPDLVGSWDRYRLEQVLNNLLTNAIRYSPGKRVSIVVRRQGDSAEILVKDQGQGISIEDQARIFERFERAVASNNISGLGLGLYICRQIVQSHQGTIRVESTVGEGSTFIVELPLAS